MADPITSPCPICKKSVARGTTAPKSAPFCSTRCQQVDLGKWLNDEYRVPSDDTDEEGDEGDGNSGVPTSSHENESN